MNRPTPPDQDLAKAVHLHQIGDLGSAIRLYEKIVRKQPRHAAALNLLGLARFQSGRLEEAVSPMEKALAIQPDLPDARYNLSLILHSLRRFEDAIPHLEHVVAERPNDADARNNLGAVLKEAGRYEEAAEQYRAALTLNSGYADAHCNLGITLLALDRAQEAEESFRRALQLRPFFAEADVGLGNALIANDRAREALEHFDRAIKLQRGNAEAVFGFGHALATLERHEDAIPYLRKAIELKPDHLDAHMKLGWSLHAEKQYDAAVECFERALALEPERNAGIYTSRGNVFSHLERYEDSIADFDKAIEVNPAFVEAYTSKGRVLLTLGRLDEGRRCFEKAVELDPRKVGPHLALAHMNGIGGDEARLAALEDLAKDMAGLSAGEQMWLHAALGKVYSDSKQFERAISHMIEAGRIKRSKLDYDEKHTLEHFERIQQVFSPELIQNKQGLGDPTDVPVFIVGMPRSGTTLIEQILASHPAVFAAGERDDFLALVGRLGEKDSVRFPEIVTGMSGEALSALGADYVRRVRADGKDAARITDKMPGNFYNVGLIHLALPNAKIIHLNRDPLDNCMSCLSTMFANGHAYSYDLGEIGRYHRAYQALMRHWRSVLPEGAMLDVQYEDVVDDLEFHARRIVAHCGLEWDEACLAFHKTERPVRTASVTQVRQPIYRSSVGRWGAYREQLRPLFEALEID